ncbi:sensor histidine kinase [Agrobacterium leguminum]|uniref:sensor histidine kinase n=1 Tax=Agrobacterium leguminum TaxID=2792015 RepID=UPI003CE4E133
MMLSLPRSIRVRLLLLALAGTFAAILLAGLGLVALFDRYAERRAAQELSNYLTQLAGSISADEGGKLTVDGGPPNPRFTVYASGLYWLAQDGETGQVLRSASLGQSVFPLPSGMATDGPAVVDHVTLPDGHTGLVHARIIDIAPDATVRPVALALAMDRKDMNDLRAGFAADMIPGLLLVGALSIAGAWMQVRLGLRPLYEVQAQINAIRSGARTRLSPDVPPEVAPLVQEVNTLLDAQADQMERMRNHAADLAHGIKTPLTALGTDIRRLKERGEAKLAGDIEALTSQMRRTVERELARSRYRNLGSGRAETGVSEVIHGLARTLTRTPAGEGKIFDDSLPAGFSIAMEREDLADVLGNILENAFRAARSRIAVSGHADSAGCSITVEDDGEGIDDEKLETLTRRGSQFSGPAGSAGLGLAIVAEILALYNGSIQFSHSSLRGLEVTVRVPRMLRPEA